MSNNEWSIITNVKLIPLRDSSFITLLRSLNCLWCSNVGPNGNYKLLVTGGGYIHLTSLSRHILQHQDQFCNPIVQFIIQIMKNRPDYGLYTGILITACVEKQLSLQMNNVITNKQSIDLFNMLLNINESFFDKFKVKINFDSISNLIPIVRTILQSKVGVFNFRKSIMEITLQIVKSFLFTLDTDRMLFGDTTVVVGLGQDECKFFPGIVYQLTEDDHWIFNVLNKTGFKCNGSMRTLLFTMSLDDDLNDVDCMKHLKLNKIYEVLEKAITLGVHLIACQKVVNSDIVMFLRRKSVIVIERLGTSLAKKFEQVTGSFPVTSINELTDEVEQLFGVVSDISTFTFRRKCFLLMEPQSGCSTNAGTLMINTSSVAGTEQMKVLVEQALKSLRVLVKESYVLPGAGCFEVSFFYSIQELCKKVMNHNPKWLLEVLRAASGGNRDQFEVDSCFNHLWISTVDATCNCRLVSREFVLNTGGTWSIPSDTITNMAESDVCVSSNQLTLTPDAIVDSYELKRNALIISFESCINLLNIGTIACKEL